VQNRGHVLTGATFGRGLGKSALVVSMVLALVLGLSSTVFAQTPVPQGDYFPDIYDLTSEKWENGNIAGYSEGEVAPMAVKVEGHAGQLMQIELCLEVYEIKAGTYLYAFSAFQAWDTVLIPPTLPDGTPVNYADGNWNMSHAFVWGYNVADVSVSAPALGSGNCNPEDLGVVVQFRPVANPNGYSYFLYGGQIAAPGDPLPAGLPHSTVPAGQGASQISGTFQSGVYGTGWKTINFKTPIASYQPGTIVVEKQTIPDGETGTFTFTGDAAGSISDDGTITVPNLHPGTYYSTESDPSPFTLTSIVCTDGQSPQDTAGDVSTRTATFKVRAGDTVTCTFFNAAADVQAIIVDKVTDPSGSPESFDFELSDGTGVVDTFSLIDGATPYDSGNVSPDTYTVSEDVPDGWELTGVECDDDDYNPDNPGEVLLDEGEIVTCVFYDTQQGTITLVKETDPPGGTGFEINIQGPTGGGSQFVDDGDSFGIVDTLPSDYDATEITIPPDWYLVDVSCVGGATDPIADGVRIHLGAGEHITCIFTNSTQAPGRIIVDKVTDPAGSDRTFAFSLSDETGVIDTFSLTDAQTPYDSGPLGAGAYSVVETVPPDWILASATCSDGSHHSQIGLDSGETVTCVFTNRIPVTVEEEFVPEWGSIGLLISGLGGLAGYARMRRRKR
jgi:hypothetical protein